MGMKTILYVLITLSFLNTNSIAQQASSPCSCCDESYQQFDFWIGDWIVKQKGKMAGFNKIVKIENNCVIRENWKSYGSAYTGTSYNFYDKLEKKWKLVWVDNQGTTLLLTGGRVGNQMILSSKEKIDEDGKGVINRITWTNNSDGTVRQLWEQSQDGGITFTPLFDGLYRKRKKP